MNRILYQLLFAFLIIFYLSNGSFSEDGDTETDTAETNIDIGDLAEAIAEGTSVEAIAAEIVDEIEEIANLDLETLTSTLESVIAELGSTISADELAEAITEALEAAALEEAEPTEEPDTETDLDGDVVLVDGVPTAVVIGVDSNAGFESGSGGILTLCDAVGGNCTVTQTTADSTTFTTLLCGVGVPDASAIFVAAQGDSNECLIDVDIEASSGAANSDLSDSSSSSVSAAGAAGCLQNIADALATLNCAGEDAADLPATDVGAGTSTPTTTRARGDCPCAEDVDTLLDACSGEDCDVTSGLGYTQISCGDGDATLMVTSLACVSSIDGVATLTEAQEESCIALLGEFVLERAIQNNTCDNSNDIIDDDTFLGDDALGLGFCSGPNDNTTVTQPGDRITILQECRAELLEELGPYDGECCTIVAGIAAAATRGVIYTCEELEAQCVTNGCLELVSGDASDADHAADRADNVMDQYSDNFCENVNITIS